MGAAGSRESAGNLTKAELERVRRRFERQAGKSGRLSLADLQRMPELSGNFFVGRIFQHSDKDKDGYITVEDFTLAVERIGKVYSDEEKIRFAFDLYDLDEDGFVSRRDLMGVLQQTSRSTVNQQQLERTVASLVQEHDADGDGRLSFPEFRRLAAARGAEARPFLG